MNYLNVPPRHVERHNFEHAAFNASPLTWQLQTYSHDEHHAALRAWWDLHHVNNPLPVVTNANHELVHDLIDAWLQEKSAPE